MSPEEHALASADQLIEDVFSHTGVNYVGYRETIAKQLYENGIYDGNWDSSTDLEDLVFKDLRLIQEDEYDQSMDEDEDRPSEDSMICQTTDGYVWFA